MTLIIPPGYMQIALRFGLTGDPEVMVSTIGADVQVDAQTELEDITDDWASKWAGGEMVVGYSFLGATAQVGQDGGPPNVLEYPLNIAGTFSAPPPPSNLAVLVRKGTALGGRRGRGRMFWPPFVYSEGNVDANGMWVSTIPTAQNIKLASWRSEHNFVLLHNDATIPSPITSLIWDPQAATQRRRMRS